MPRVEPRAHLLLAAAVEIDAANRLVAEAVDAAHDAGTHDAPGAGPLPAADADRRRVEADVQIVAVNLILRFLQPGAAGEDRELHALRRAEVVHGLGLRVREPELHLVIDQPLDHEIEVTLARRDQPGATLSAERPFDDQGHARSADGGAHLRPFARPGADVELDRGAGAIPRPLHVAAAHERDVLQDVAVDHRDRARARLVLDGADGVQQVGRGEAVERQVHVREIAAADGELAAQVVAGRHAGQDLHGSQRIVGEDAAEVLDIGAPEHLLGRRARVGRTEPIGADGHGLGIAGAAGQGDRHFRDLPGHDRHRTLGDRVADDRRPQPPDAGQHGHLEPTVPAGDGRGPALARGHVSDQDAAERRACPGVQHHAPDRALAPRPWGLVLLS